MTCINQWKRAYRRLARQWVKNTDNQDRSNCRSAGVTLTSVADLGSAKKTDAMSASEADSALQAINERLSAFNYMVSHELRAGLRVMDGTVALLRGELTDYGSSTVQYGLRQMQSSVQHMQSTVTELLRMAALDQREMVRQHVNVSELAEQVISELRVVNPMHQVQVSVEPNLMAYAEATLLRELLRNLLSNAWKFTEGCSQPRVQVGVCEERGQCCFYVRDNGIGFSAEQQKELFKPFRRLANATAHEGTGVGLYTVKRIVERHQGRVWVRAEAHHGASFFFTLGERRANSQVENCQRAAG